LDEVASVVLEERERDFFAVPEFRVPGDIDRNERLCRNRRFQATILFAPVGNDIRKSIVANITKQ
jgi:hypothetical protein